MRPNRSTARLKFKSVDGDLLLQIVEGGRFLRLQRPAGLDGLFELGQSFPIARDVIGVMQKEVIGFGAAGVQHLDGSALGIGGHGGIDVHNAVHDRAHGEQVIDGQENDRHQDQAYQAQAHRHSAAKREALQQNPERSPRTPWHKSVSPPDRSSNFTSTIHGDINVCAWGCSGGLRPPASIGDRRYNLCRTIYLMADGGILLQNLPGKGRIRCIDGEGCPPVLCRPLTNHVATVSTFLTVGSSHANHLPTAQRRSPRSGRY